MTQRQTVPDTEKADRLKDLPDEQRRAIRGWCMYDWANSAFATSVGAAILPVYFIALFREAFGPEIDLLGFTVTGSSIWGLGVALSTAVVAFTSPVLGVIADRVEIKKVLLQVYTAGGAAFTVLSFFSAYTGAAWAWVIGCFVIANIGFAGGTVFYNSLLPHLAPKDLLDDVSSRGFAYGYIGGGLLLAVHLALILAFKDSGHIDLVTRLTLASVGVWWYGWAIWTFKTVPEPHIVDPVRGLTPARAAVMAFTELRRLFRELTRFRMLVVFLVSYLLFNDGIQTVLTIAGAFAADTLGISLQFNIATVLLIQFIAAPGAILFGSLSARVTTKRALGVALIGWCLIIMLAVGFAPLEPEAHGDFDYRLEHAEAGQYELARVPELSDSKTDKEWKEAYGQLIESDSLGRRSAAQLADAVATSALSRFSISISGGPLDGTRAVGPEHPSVLGNGLIDWWPRAFRDLLWVRLGLSVDSQWLLLGVLAGIVLGGSQALARSLFAQMTPESRSAEFFAFFGFISRASAVIGPIVYLLVIGVSDSRVAVLMILLMILAGTAILRWVDVGQGRSVAENEDARHLRAHAATDKSA